MDSVFKRTRYQTSEIHIRVSAVNWDNKQKVVRLLKSTGLVRNRSCFTTIKVNTAEEHVWVSGDTPIAITTPDTSRKLALKIKENNEADALHVDHARKSIM